MLLTFNRLVRKDLRGALSHYDDAVGPHLARRFYNEFEELLALIQRNPKRFHGVPGSAYRRANFPSLPHHLILSLRQNRSCPHDKIGAPTRSRPPAE